MDYSEIRKIAIELGDLSKEKMDKNYQMYYDETNNPRLFRITEEGFNFSEKAYFILGGLALEKEKMPSKEYIDKLFDSLKLQGNTKEIKFKHVQQEAADFLELTKKSRVRTLIDWLYRNNYWIHYSYRDNFYYSIVDIIDSMEESSYGGINLNRELKNELYRNIKKDKDTFHTLLRRFEYPNIKNQKEFIESIILWIEEMNFESNFSLEYLRQSLKNYREASLVYLEDNKDFITIEDYSDIYRHLIVLFNKSNLTFDKEDFIEKKLQIDSIEISGEKLSNYDFIDSKNEKLIQLSDLTVGILRYWMEYLEGETIEDMENEFVHLGTIQKETMVKFQEILNRSLLENIAFKHGSGSNDFEDKLNFFYEYNFT